MKPYTAVMLYLDDHSTEVVHFEAETPDGWPVQDCGAAYIVVAVFEGHLDSLYSDTN